MFVVPPFISHQFISNSNLNVYNVMISTLWVKNFTNELDNLNGFFIHYLVFYHCFVPTGNLRVFTFESRRLRFIRYIIRTITKNVFC